MGRSIVELLVGNLDEKREYRQLMRRVNALPGDYRLAFKKMQHYFYCFGGGDMAMQLDLLELLETGAAEKRPVREVLGDDVSGFCDELLQASSMGDESPREALNREILSHFGLEGQIS